MGRFSMAKVIRNKIEETRSKLNSMEGKVQKTAGIICEYIDPIDKVAAREAEDLGLPVEWVKEALYEGKGKKILFYGQGYNDILALIAAKHLGKVLKFKKFKYRFMSTKVLIRIIEMQATIYESIFNQDLAGILSKGEHAVNKLNNYHILDWDEVELPEKISPALQEAIDNFDDCSLFIPKDFPCIQRCTAHWSIVLESLQDAMRPVLEGSTPYYVQYSSTSIVGVRSGAGNFLLATMKTRAKRRSYQQAFGNTEAFFLKAAKLMLRAQKEEYAENDVSQAEKNQTFSDLYEKRKAELAGRKGAMFRRNDGTGYKEHDTIPDYHNPFKVSDEDARILEEYGADLSISAKETKCDMDISREKSKVVGE